MVKTIDKTWRCCATCRNFNNGFGALSLKPLGRNLVSFESSEKHACLVNGVTREASFRCPNYVSRI